MRLLVALACAAALAACGSEMPSSDDPDASGECVQEGPSLRTLVTDDGVSLIADWYSTGQVGQPGVILVHMIPPSNTKDNYPAVFIEALIDSGLQVINVNRRGAPGSGGEAIEAYTGPNGKLDAKAGYDFLTSHPCQVPSERIAIVGASNGTTTAVDFAVFAGANGEVEPPAALVFLSGGSYTENQHLIADVVDTLDDHPVAFHYPASEAAWNEGIAGLGVQGWSFSEYAGGSHGTGLFTSHPTSIASVVEFVAEALR